jgi:hypothetical protein
MMIEYQDFDSKVRHQILSQTSNFREPISDAAHKLDQLVSVCKKCFGVVPYRGVTMRILAWTILAIGFLAAGQAQAQTYNPAFPVCMNVVEWGGTYEDCSFDTIAQCRVSAAGRGAQCNPNPYYAGVGASPRRNARRYGRVQ